ncbi:MAG: hypothetical protein C0468_06560 [Planctomyces sp.]|nr:hypothetical protein [Planctomyces sp.]
MPAVFPFHAVQYAQAVVSRGADVSPLVAPPYDVLDAHAKAALLTRSDKNIVSIDLPHIPAKELGPPAAYAAAADTLAQWVRSGVLTRRNSPVMFVYRQAFTFAGRPFKRTGMACTLAVRPFGPAPGGGVLPHEETFSGPKEDRMALMKATATQLSPIFGMHPDERHAAVAVLASVTDTRSPDFFARTADGTLHEAWALDDPATIARYQSALADEDVFIADGHHRYTTALNYLAQLGGAHDLPPDHPARRCMFVLISMSDPGLIIGPTHRVLGGMAGYSRDALGSALAPYFTLTPVPGSLQSLHEALHAHGAAQPGRLGLWDFASGTGVLATLAAPDPLAQRFPDKAPAWRTLDVALTQHLIVEQVCQPLLNAGKPVQWAFPHSVQEVIDIGAGRELGSGGGKSFSPQLAVILRPTPLESVRAVSRANLLMPQKSTFFFPKLATGLFMNPLA